ncbi:hypothetical protein BaRGS_00031177 [Batillaria attramentaria]|uniref:Uncharacterized protein n=1 Tax=Batillaria attramentaria TaxID=370345 RepID=A0ABD0JSK9_9CAEN
MLCKFTKQKKLNLPRTMSASLPVESDVNFFLLLLLSLHPQQQPNGTTEILHFSNRNDPGRLCRNSERRDFSCSSNSHNGARLCPATTRQRLVKSLQRFLSWLSLQLL